MQHEFLLRFAGQSFDALGVVGRAERQGNEGLRLASGEEGGAVAAGEKACFAGDGADLVEAAAVNSVAFVPDELPQADAGQVLKSHVQGDDVFLGAFLYSLDFLDVSFPELGELVVAFGFAGDLKGFRDAVAVALADGQGFFAGFDVSVFALHDADLGGQFVLGLDEGLELLEGVGDRFGHVGFGGLLGFAFDHDDLGGGAGDHEVEGRLGALLVVRVYDKFAVDLDDAYGRQRAGERNVGNGDGRGSGGHGHGVRVNVALGTEDLEHDLHLVVIVGREEGTHGPVDAAHGKYLFVDTYISIRDRNKMITAYVKATVICPHNISKEQKEKENNF